MELPRLDAPRPVPDRPAAPGAGPAAERRIGAFAVLVAGHANPRPATEAVEAAATGSRGEVQAEVATALEKDFRAAAETALSRTLVSGATLRTLVEAKAQGTLDAGALTGRADLPRQSAERADWREAFG